MDQVRRIVSQRMNEAARTVAPVTLTTEADATELMLVRARFKDEISGANEPVPSITDLVVRLVALALREHPDLNASLRRRDRATRVGSRRHSGRYRARAAGPRRSRRR